MLLLARGKIAWGRLVLRIAIPCDADAISRRAGLPLVGLRALLF